MSADDFVEKNSLFRYQIFPTKFCGFVNMPLDIFQQLSQAMELRWRYQNMGDSLRRSISC